MNIKQLIAAFGIFAAAGSVFAQQTEFVDPVSPRAGSGKTRAEVVAELERSKADGSYDVLHQEYEGQFPEATRMVRNNVKGTAVAGVKKPADQGQAK
jgi:hypothetical protein